MKPSSSLVVIFIFFLIMGCNSKNKSLKPEEQKFQIKYAKRIDDAGGLVFSTNRISIPGGMYTEYFEKIKSIQNEDSAQSSYIEMIKSPNLVHQLYGLYGLKVIFSNQYNEQKKQVLLNKNKKVLYGAGGCIVMVYNVIEVVAIIDKYEATNKSLE